MKPVFYTIGKLGKAERAFRGAFLNILMDNFTSFYGDVYHDNIVGLLNFQWNFVKALCEIYKQNGVEPYTAYRLAHAEFGKISVPYLIALIEKFNEEEKITPRHFWQHFSQEQLRNLAITTSLERVVSSQIEKGYLDDSSYLDLERVYLEFLSEKQKNYFFAKKNMIINARKK